MAAHLMDMTGWIMSEHGVPDSRLTVIKRGENSKNGKVRWLCECSCGNPKHVLVEGTSLRDGTTKSCGCLMRENLTKRNKDGHENTYDLSGEYGIGYTAKGEEFWFDIEDYDKIKDYTWHYSKEGYVNTVKGYRLHRLVLGIEDPKIHVDHKTHPPKTNHKVDNRKSNLRIVNQSQNTINSSLRFDNTSGYTGVYYHKKYNKWVAKISINKKAVELGYFTNKEDAIEARKDAEIKYYGEYRYDAHNAPLNEAC